MMPIIIVILGAALILFGLCLLGDDFVATLICIGLGACVAWGGYDYHQKIGQLHDSEQYVLSLKEGHKAELRLMAKKLEASQEAAMELSIENHALQNQQTECVEKQQVSQDTLSGIKEILEN